MDGLLALCLSQTEVSDLTPIAGMRALRRLEIENMPLTNLGPIAGLVELRSLYLEHTNVGDLRPILLLPKLGEGAETGLDFAFTPFARATDETRRLTDIEDRQQRTRETLTFLKTLPPWPEPLPWEVAEVERRAAGPAPLLPPEQDPALPLIWGERGFQFLVDHIGVDPVTQEVLADLRALLDTLIRQTGNSHEDLYQLAREMRERCEPENGVLNALRLHLPLQKLERLNAARDRRERALDDEIATTLEGVLRIAPGATLADPKVRELIERQEANLAPRPSVEIPREAALLRIVAEPGAPFSPEVQ